MINNTFVNFTSSTIDSSLFIGNTAVFGGDGGAIENWGGPLTISSSTFIDNQSFQGGAIEDLWGNAFFAQPLPTGAFTVKNSTFLGNQADGNSAQFGSQPCHGGAIDVSGANGPVSITGSTFVGNRAVGGDGGSNTGLDGSGGAINLSGNLPELPPFTIQTFTIDRSTFVDNQAIGGHGDTAGGPAFGGAFGFVDFDLGLGVILNVSVTNSQFVGNSAVGGSGGSGDTFPYFNTLDQSAFGGAVEVAAVSGTTSGSTFVGNEAVGGNGGPGQLAGVGEGGAVDNFFTNLTLSSSTFTGNQAIGGTGGNASAGSSANGGAGGQAVGGAFANDDFLPYGSTVSLTGLTLTGNQAIGGAGGAGAGSGGVGGDALGGGILNAGGLDVSSSRFIGDEAIGGEGGHGGATGVGGVGGDGDGGAILSASFGDPTVSVLTVSTQRVHRQRCDRRRRWPGATDGPDGQGLGGAIANLDGTATITKSKFAGNKASTSGDDIYGSYMS